MDYAKDIDKLTGFTATYKRPTQFECAEEITDAMTQYARKKWYEEKKCLFKKAISYARIYNEIEDELNH